jgi:hypothetical protein
VDYLASRAGDDRTEYRIDEQFREHLKERRKHWPGRQAETPNILLDNGIHPMRPTTIAKIGAGDRLLRFNKAVGIADMFEVSVDFLLGRNG